jgi:hypothetical protein
MYRLVLDRRKVFERVHRTAEAPQLICPTSVWFAHQALWDVEATFRGPSPRGASQWALLLLNQMEALMVWIVCAQVTVCSQWSSRLQV